MNLSHHPLVGLNRIIGVLLLLLVTGCSTIKLGYNNAPTLTYWWLDGYVDFNAFQSGPAHEGLNELHAWHRQHALPAYIETLRKLEQLAPDNVTPDQLCALWSEVHGHIQQLERASVKSINAVSPRFEEDQFRHLSRKFDKRNEKWREDWLETSSSAQLERRFKQTVDRAEMLYDSLDDAQRKILRASLEHSIFDARLSYTETLRRQQDILQLLRKHSAPPASQTPGQQTEILALLERLRRSPDPVYRDLQEKLALESCQMYAAMHNSTTPKQRALLLEKLRDYEAELRTLSQLKR
jgi:hypothetical protein